MGVIQAENPIFTVPLRDIDGHSAPLKAWEGKVLLIVNVASRCGLTPQYAGLEALQQKYQARGFTVLGFPCNQFLYEEPGSHEEIKTFCDLNYRITFPLFSKIEVNGKTRHPLYELLAGRNSPFPGRILWNFTKFLVGRDGTILNRFGPLTKPQSTKVSAAIEAAL